MIGRLRGIVVEKKPPLILLEVNGVSYEIHVPITYFYTFLEEDKELVIFTHLIVRENEYLLFGFSNSQELTLFRNLIKINSIGPKLALAILSNMSIQQFINVIEQEDITNLIKLPGISRKIAERLIFEIKNRFKKKYGKIFPSFVEFEIDNLSFSSKLKKNKAQEEAISALITLGYKSKEASQMVKKVARLDADSKTLICDALRLVL